MVYKANVNLKLNHCENSSLHRAELKKELESLKESLATRLAGKRAADHMLFKMEAEVKRAARAVGQLEEEGAHLASRLEEVTLETETSKKSHGKHTEMVIYLGCWVSLQNIRHGALAAKLAWA